MFLAVLGTPSPLTAVVLKVVQALTESALGRYHWIAAGTADDLRKAWIERGEQPILMFADIPSREITRMVADTSVPFVVCLEQPATIVNHVARTRDLTGLPALRLASQSLATLHDISFVPTAHLMLSSEADVQLDRLIENLARIYRLELSTEHLIEVTSKLSANCRLATLRDLMPTGPAGLPSTDMSIASDVLGGFSPVFTGRPAERFTWPPNVFLGAKPLGEPIAAPIELIGGRRCFAFGPYFHLPAGRWQVTVDFEVSENVSGNILKIDAYTDGVIAEGTARLPREGRFKCRIEIVIDEPRLPLQVRLFIEEGAIEGRFTLHGVNVERTS
jgi:hypothetical protein